MARFLLLLGVAAIWVANPCTAAVGSATPPGQTEADSVLIGQLAERLKSRLGTKDNSERSVARSYVSLPGHKALAAGRNAEGFKSVQVVSKEPSPISAQSLALERCQMLVVDPCTIMAVDREITPAPADGKWPLRDVARLSYHDDFDPNMIPAVATADRNRPEIGAYARAPIPKAAAINGNGKIVFASAVKSQSDAEAQVLMKCQSQGGEDCFLYAVGNQVVLPQRFKEPRPLGNSLAEVLAYALVPDSALRASSFSSLKTHKSMILFPELRATMNFVQFNSSEAAKQIGLESCGLKFNTACVALAVDDDLDIRDPSTTPRSPMPRLTYQGPYMPEMVPLFSTAPKIAVDYVKMPAPKAMVIGPQGLKIAAETGATLAEAQAKALAKCTDPDSPYPCFIYAVNDTVILPQRRTEPVP